MNIDVILCGIEKWDIQYDLYKYGIWHDQMEIRKRRIFSSMRIKYGKYLRKKGNLMSGKQAKKFALLLWGHNVTQRPKDK